LGPKFSSDGEVVFSCTELVAEINKLGKEKMLNTRKSENVASTYLIEQRLVKVVIISEEEVTYTAHLSEKN